MAQGRLLSPSLDDLQKPDTQTLSLEDKGGGTKQTNTKIFLVDKRNRGKLGNLTWE